MPNFQRPVTCPVCKGKGKIMPPSPRMDLTAKREAAHVLRNANYSLRQIRDLLGYKAVGGVQKLLKKK